MRSAASGVGRLIIVSWATRLSLLDFCTGCCVSHTFSLCQTDVLLICSLSWGWTQRRRSSSRQTRSVSVTARCRAISSQICKPSSSAGITWHSQRGPSLTACPCGLADYYYNNECSEAVIYSTLNSATPGIQVSCPHSVTRMFLAAAATGVRPDGTIS